MPNCSSCRFSALVTPFLGASLFSNSVSPFKCIFFNEYIIKWFFSVPLKGTRVPQFEKGCTRICKHFILVKYICWVNCLPKILRSEFYSKKKENILPA